MGNYSSIENLIDDLEEGLVELDYQFNELETFTGIDFSVCQYRSSGFDLITAARKLWQNKKFQFEQGKHYRFGRLENPNHW